MHKVIRILLLITLFLISACGSKDAGDEQNNGNTNNAKPDNEVEQASNEKLRLGDTATIKNTLYEYEVTPTSFEMIGVGCQSLPELNGIMF